MSRRSSSYSINSSKSARAYFRKNKKRIAIIFGTFVVAFSIIAGLIIPALQAKAEQTLTWTSNADFAYNKISGCMALTLDGIETSTSAYTDPSCNQTGQDSSLKLKLNDPSLRASSLSAGAYQSCSVTNGKAYCWGYNYSGQLGDNTTTDKSLPVAVDTSIMSGTVTAISTGSLHSCAIADGKAYCWGNNYTGQLGDNTTTNKSAPVAVNTSIMSGTVTAIYAGDSHSCAIADGKAYCWGYNYYGQLGNNSSSQRNTPAAVGTSIMSGTVTAMAVGAYNSCAIADGKAYCWGSNGSGQLGDNTTNPSYDPVAVNTSVMSGTVTAISTGSGQSCAIADGKAYCWGYNGYGQLGDTTTDNKTAPTAVDTSIMNGTVTTIAAGPYNSCAIAGGKAYCWGYNGNGQLGDTTTDNKTAPTAVDTSIMNGTVTTIATGNSHGCAITDGKAYCWGGNAYGQIGTTTNYGSSSPNGPTLVKNAEVVGMANSSIGSSRASTVCSIISGKAYCWGSNNTGQLGNSTTTDSSTSVAVDTSTMSGTVTAIASGSNHSCAISGGKVYCWGYNAYGQLGNNTTNQSNTPVAVDTSIMSGTVTAIASGSLQSCAVADGKTYCWGYNGYGQLGDNTTNQSNTPVAVDTSIMSGTVTAIASGSNHSCAISGGKVYCWGYNGNGQLGDNTTNYSLTPIVVDTSVMSGSVTAIAAGNSHSCAIADSKAYCWGDNYNGLLGDSTTTQRNVPVAVNTSVMSGSVTAIAAGDSHSCAIADGKAYCWGYNYSGQLGDNTTNQRNAPVAVDTSVMSGTILDIKAGSNNSYATTASGSYSWGSGSQGTLNYYGYNGSYYSSILHPVRMTFSINYISGYNTSGSLSGMTFDAGQGKKTKWYTIGWNTAALPSGGSVSFSARVSDDKVNWSAWTPTFTQNTTSSTSGSGNLQDLPISRYVELSMNMNSTNSSTSPELNDFSLSFLDDKTAPITNASNLKMYKQKNSTEMQQNDWTNQSNSYFNWDVANDNVNGSGIEGYCLYLGHDNTASPIQTKGYLGNSPLDTGGACQYAVTSTELDLGLAGTLLTDLETSNSPYYLLISALDYSGNVFQGSPQSFTFKYDNTAPTNPFFVSAPSQFVSNKAVTLTWPTTGGESPQDSNSGIAGLQYRIGSTGTWYGASHNGAQNFTDLLSNNGTYVMNETYDYPGLNDGNNIIYFRTYDNAGNISLSYVTAIIKINTSSPSQPQNLTATPTTNNTNSFAFSWLPPVSHVGAISGITYCYTVNSIPTLSNCNYTVAGQISLTDDSFATQPGNNTLYLVAKDEAGNINYDTYASTVFTANTPAPGIPKDFEIADVSTKASSLWKLAISWSAPADAGAGVSKYSIYRSNDGISYSQVANTSGLSYVDSSLTQVLYNYKIRACDSANNCGAYSEPVSMTPTGRYTSPPVLVGNVTSNVSTRTAKFSWVTDRDSDSRVQYGKSSGVYLTSEVAVSDPVKLHSVELNNLDAGTTYYYKVKWTDEDGNTGLSSELTFTTLPAPIVKDVLVIKKSLTSALVQFTSVNADKIDLLYGKSDGFGGLVSINTSRSESTYTVELTGLDDGTGYLFKINTYDSEGNNYDSHRIDNFSTPPRPKISDLRFQPINGEPTSTQKVTWTTNVPTDSTITYGIVGTNGTDIYLSKQSTDHEIIIRGLEDDSSYFLLPQSRDADGNLAVGDRQFFKTALDTRPPEISDIRVTSSIKGNGSDGKGQIVVYWKTDEAATSQVAYALGASGNDYPNSTVEDAQLTIDHVVIISDLSVSNVYHLQPVSKDRSGNMTTGENKSTVIGRPTESILNIILKSIQGIFGI
jgi:alpha-tubulin suppressor-like RCC1 family protein